MNIDIVNLKKQVKMLQDELASRDALMSHKFENGMVLTNVASPSEFDQRVFSGLCDEVKLSVSKKLRMPKRVGPHNKPSGRLEENWDKLMAIYNENRDLSAPKIADEMLKRHNVVISTYFINRFRIMMRTQEQALQPGVTAVAPAAN